MKQDMALRSKKGQNFICFLLLTNKKRSKNKTIEQDFQLFENIATQPNMGSVINIAEP